MEKKLCSKCDQPKLESEFYHRKNRKNSATGMCKTCFNSYCVQRWIERKIEAIHYKGDHCGDCSIAFPDYPYVIFEFHHLDPNQKDMDWGEMRKTSWVNIVKELDKCVLLCSNCHKIRHHNMVALQGIEP